jgi:two-component system response regulator EvgA
MTLKVLIVDDKIPFLDSAIRYLNLQTGIKLVGWALNGAEALEKNKIYMPDLVLIDISLPDTSGLAIIQDMKNLNSQQKIIVLTLYGNDEYEKGARQAGADGFISKTNFVKEFPELLTQLFQ